MAKRRMTQALTLGAVGPLALAFAGCDHDESSETAYCVNQNEEVVENRFCGDDDEGRDRSYVWFFYGGTLSRGQSTRGLAGDRIASTNRAALASRGVFGGGANANGVGRSTAS